MVLHAFDAHQRSPQGVLRRKALSFDQARTLTGSVAASHLRRQRQEQLIQAALSEAVAIWNRKLTKQFPTAQLARKGN